MTERAGDAPLGSSSPLDSAGATPARETWFQEPYEREFATVLDAYGVRWEYEPRTFVFARDPDGNPTEAFSPDFYLPDQDVYFELTTMAPSLIRRKRKKIRRLRECFPEVECRLFDLRDLEALAARFDLDVRTAADMPAPQARTPAEDQPPARG